MPSYGPMLIIEKPEGILCSLEDVYGINFCLYDHRLVFGPIDSPGILIWANIYDHKASSNAANRLRRWAIKVKS